MNNPPPKKKKTDIDATALMADGRGMSGPEDSSGAIISLWCNWADDPQILKTLLAEFEPRQPLAAGEASDGPGSEGGNSTGGLGEATGGADEESPQQEMEEEEGGESSDVHLHLSEVCLGRLLCRFCWWCLCCREGCVRACCCVSSGVGESRCFGRTARQVFKGGGASV